MSSNSINQGAAGGIIIQPTWGTIEGNGSPGKEDNFDAILNELRTYLDAKADKKDVYTKDETDDLLDGKSDTGHTHDDRYYTETETDGLLDNKFDISTWETTGRLSINVPGTVDVTKADNNVTSTKYYSFSVKDSNDLLITNHETQVDPAGTVRSIWYLRNYNTSGSITGSKGIQMVMDKAGTLTYNVHDASNFRSAISAAATSHEHSTSNITSGILPIERGGTNAETVAKARQNLFDENLASNGEYLIAITTNWAKGGYIQKSSALSWIGAAASNHTHTSLKDPANSNYTLGLKWTGEATTASYLCAWADQSGFTKVIQAISPANVRTVIGAAAASHTHNYAGSSSAGGAANSLVNFTVNKSTGQNANNVNYAAHTYYTSNGPATSLGAKSTDGALYTQAYSDNWICQIAQDYRTGRLFVRGKNNGTWQDWRAVSHHIISTTGLTEGTSALETGMIYYQY